MPTSVRSPSIQSSGAVIRFQNSSHSSTWPGSGSSACGSGRRAGASASSRRLARSRLDQWPASQRGAVAAQQRVGLRAAARRRRSSVGVGAQRLRRLQLVQPLNAIRFGACSGRERGMPKPSRLTRRRTRVGPHARVEHRDVAAHAVAEQVDRRRARRRTARRAPARGRPGTRGRSRCRPPACRSRRSRASRARSRGARSASASTTNWNDAATSIQPCSMTSVGRSARVERRVAPFEQVVAKAAGGDEDGCAPGGAAGSSRQDPSRHVGAEPADGAAGGAGAGCTIRACLHETAVASLRHPRRRAARRRGHRPPDPRAWPSSRSSTHLVQVTPEKLAPHLFGAAAGRRGAGRRRGRRVVGFALFFTNFSTFLAKPGLYLEDLFVEPEQRGRGIGQALLDAPGRARRRARLRPLRMERARLER